MQKNRRLRDALLVSLFRKTKGFFCLSFNNSLQKVPPSFFAYILTGKRRANQRKKIRGCDFQLNQRAHAKIQLIWTKKKKQTKIRHRMVMLRRLQLINYNVITVLIGFGFMMHN